MRTSTLLAVAALPCLLACPDEPPPAPATDKPAPTPDPAPDKPTAAADNPAPAADKPAAAADKPAPPHEPGAVTTLKTFKFPGGEVLVPKSWNPSHRDETPKTSLHVMPALALTCDLGVLEGHGSAKQAEEYLSAGAAAYKGEVERARDVVVGDKRFQGIVVTKPKALPDNADAVVEIYAAIAGDNLVTLGVTKLEKREQHERARANCLGAFASYLKGLPAGPPTAPSQP
jgi:hypothetical protein